MLPQCYGPFISGHWLCSQLDFNQTLVLLFVLFFTTLRLRSSCLGYMLARCSGAGAWLGRSRHAWCNSKWWCMGMQRQAKTTSCIENAAQKLHRGST